MKFPTVEGDRSRAASALIAAVLALAGCGGSDEAPDATPAASIARPPVNGVGYRVANRRLRALGRDPELAAHLRIVPWAAAAARQPDWLASDGVHGTPTGYAGRAQLYARAALSC